MNAVALRNLIEDRRRAFMGLMTTYRVSFLLDLQDSAILKGPFDNVGLRRGALDEFALVKLRPPGSKLLKFDQVPDVREWCFNNSRLLDGGGGGDAGGRHGISVAFLNGFRRELIAEQGRICGVREERERM